MTRLLSFLRRKPSPSSASEAKDRLTLLITHQRLSDHHAEVLPQLQREIMALLARHLSVEHVDAQVRLTRHADSDLLQVEVVLPAP